jgi:hypothetical protein
MAPQEFAALARIEALDKETARRAAQLIVECCAPPSLALAAVLEARAKERTMQPSHLSLWLREPEPRAPKHRQATSKGRGDVIG